MAKGKPSKSNRRKGGIKLNPRNKGKIRKAAKAKKGEKIPLSTLQRMKRSAKTTKRKRQIQFAINSRKWKH